LASAWVGRLPANFNACSARLAAGAGRRQPQPQRSRFKFRWHSKKSIFFIGARPLYRLRQTKIPPQTAVCRAYRLLSMKL